VEQQEQRDGTIISGASEATEKLEATEAALITTSVPARRYVVGRYRVAVEGFLANGEAHGRVIEILHTPAPAEFEEVYGRGEMMTPDELIFVGGLPGEIVEVEASWSLPRPGRKRAKHVPPPVVRVLSIIEASPERVQTVCPVFGACGGCQFQHLAYQAQLDWKTGRVRAALAGAGFAEQQVLPAIGCASPWHYRNHMRFSVNRDGQAGLTARGTHRVLPLTNCPIAHERINDALAVLSRQPLPQPQVLMRYSEASNHLLLQPEPDASARAELEAAGLTVRESDMEESLCGISFRIRPSSFFQTNTTQANKMAELVLGSIPSGEGTTWVDAYCGVGTFARLMAERVSSVIAIEESASAVRDARWNLRDVNNVEILQGKVEALLPAMTCRLDGLVIDPPRAGCQRPVLDALVERPLPRVIYVSCNPDTLARDLAYLCLKQSAYRIRSVQPLDMFPQTAHIETIVVLEAS
jgi:23S rRNA (uracil1939-C5)-methyltransferase